MTTDYHRDTDNKSDRAGPHATAHKLSEAAGIPAQAFYSLDWFALATSAARRFSDLLAVACHHQDQKQQR